MGVVDEAIHDGVRQGGIAHGLMPFIDGDLSGDERGADAVAIFEKLEEIETLLVIEPFEPPVVEDDEIGFRRGRDEPPVGAVVLGGRELSQEGGHSSVEDRVAFHACPVAQGVSSFAVSSPM